MARFAGVPWRSSRMAAINRRMCDNDAYASSNVAYVYGGIMCNGSVAISAEARLMAAAATTVARGGIFTNMSGWYYV